MTRLVVFGNSGSGKSTYAVRRCAASGDAHLDLDAVAWLPAAPEPTRRPVAEASTVLLDFANTHTHWVIEGCYAELLTMVLPYASEMVFLNPGVQTCIDNARQRPWEPHKYADASAQDANLQMLIEWIRGYPQRDDDCSLHAHRQLFDGFVGPKRELRSNEPPEPV